MHAPDRAQGRSASCDDRCRLSTARRPSAPGLSEAVLRVAEDVVRSLSDEFRQDVPDSLNSFGTGGLDVGRTDGFRIVKDFVAATK